MGVEKKSIPTLQDDRTIRKIVNIHDHIMLAFAGLSADARVIVDYSRRECESYKLTLDDLPKVWHVALKISDLKQVNHFFKYISSNQSEGMGVYFVNFKINKIFFFFFKFEIFLKDLLIIFKNLGLYSNGGSPTIWSFYSTRRY